MKSKEAIREQYKIRRNELGERQREILSLKIKDKCLDLLDQFPSIKHVHLFLPIERLNEVDTIPIMEEFQKKGIWIYTSLTDFCTEEMRTVLLSPGTALEIDEFGMPIPAIVHLAEVSAIELVLVPLLAFDLNGNRLGYGKGFYDRFLQELDPYTLKVGLSFFPAEAIIPKEEHDVPLDMCILPDEIVYFNQ